MRAVAEVCGYFGNPEERESSLLEAVIRRGKKTVTEDDSVGVTVIRKCNHKLCIKMTNDSNFQSKSRL